MNKYHAMNRIPPWVAEVRDLMESYANKPKNLADMDELRQKAGAIIRAALTVEDFKYQFVCDLTINTPTSTMLRSELSYSYAGWCPEHFLVRAGDPEFVNARWMV